MRSSGEGSPPQGGGSTSASREQACNRDPAPVTAHSWTVHLLLKWLVQAESGIRLLAGSLLFLQAHRALMSPQQLWAQPQGTKSPEARQPGGEEGQAPDRPGFQPRKAGGLGSSGPASPQYLAPSPL